MKIALDKGTNDYNRVQNNTKIFRQLDDSDPLCEIREDEDYTDSKVYTQELNMDMNFHDIETPLVKNIVSKIDDHRVFVNKYPGKLYIALNSLEKLNLEPGSRLSLKLSLGDKQILAYQFTGNNFIRIQQFVSVPIISSKKANIVIKATIKVRCDGKPDKKYESLMKFNQRTIENMHNKLEEVKFNWAAVSDLNITSIINKILLKSSTVDALLRCHCSYMSDQEVPKPTVNLIEMCKSIMVRKYSCICLFEGFLNIKSPNNNYKWVRRYVKWHGYMLYMFDVNTNDFVDNVSLLNSTPILDSLKKNIFKFSEESSKIEIHCDTQEALLGTMEAICTIFPKVLDWI